jgi:hypothetical protein
MRRQRRDRPVGGDRTQTEPGEDEKASTDGHLDHEVVCHQPILALWSSSKPVTASRGLAEG